MVEDFDKQDIVTHALESSPGLSGSQLTERRVQLSIVKGPKPDLVVEIDRFPFRVGKGADSDLQIPDVTVSREHFILEQDQGSFLIRDLGSTNGTWIEDMRIREAYLRPGALIKAGKVELRFEPVYRALALTAAESNRFGPLVGRSLAMRQIFTLLDRVANTDATVIILGETGTGKGAVAKTLHDASPRRDKPFVVVDCGAIADNLIESELFGHEKGAFTGATTSRRGALEQAAGGTLFIDELLDLRLDLQPKLLRALEEREFRRLGSNQSHRLDARIVAASKRDLWAEVEAGRFREDLYFRLAVFTIPLPPLRERLEDITLLVARFADDLKITEEQRHRLNRALIERLQEHHWPGNIRELRNAVERYLYFGDLQLGPQQRTPRSQGPAQGQSQPGSAATNAAQQDLAAQKNSASMSRSPGAAPSVVGQHVQGVAHAPDQKAIAPGPLPSATPPQILSPVPSTTRPASIDNTASPQAEPETTTGSQALLGVDLEQPYKKAKEYLLEQFEKAYLNNLLPRCGWQISHAARSAGIDRKHLYTLLKKYNIDTNKDDDA